MSVAQICAPGFAHQRRHRLSRAQRNQIYSAHGVPHGRRRGFVLDHEAPLEIGGADIAANIVPETRAEAQRKDLDENRLHRELCSGVISLAGARAEMTETWGKR